MHGRIVLIGIVALLLGHALAQQPKKQASQFEQFQRRSREAEARGLAEPYRGITTDGKVQAGLFKIRSTGVSTEPVRAAAVKFLGALKTEQRAKSTFPVDDSEWRKWMNQHFYVRQGVSFLEMTEAQRELAFGLMRAGLSAKGLQLSQDIMKLNHTLAELKGDFESLGQWLYHVTIMGEPSATKPWGWQVDGHHLIINYFVLGDQVVMTPLFVGSEPVRAPSGKFKGVTILQQEQSDGLAMLRALDEEQRKRAVLATAKPGNNNLTEAFKDNLTIPYAGVPASALTTAQQNRLLDLIGLFVGNLDDGHAKVRMEEVRGHLAQTHFAWIGGSADDSVFYFRIHSPVVLIEFDHQRPANLRQTAASPDLPNREHIHVVVRTPNGNDYGKDLLRQHYEQFKH
jgi:hypothetical protein